MSFPRYPRYKDSGVEWLGQVPEHWDVKRFKRIFKEREERSANGDELLLSVSAYTGVSPRSEVIDEGDHLSRAESLVGYKVCHVDDLVMNIMLAWNRGLAFTRYNGIVSPAYCVFYITDGSDPCFLNYLVRSDRYTLYFKAYSAGVIDSRLRIYPETFGQLFCNLPPLSEQIAIVAFLDRETEKIDELVAEQRRLMELLKEKRQAVISDAVTRGLNAAVPLKPSGTEWLGNVPKHWSVQPLFLRYQAVLGKMVDEKQKTGEHPVSYLRNADVNWDRININDLPTFDVTPEEEERCLLRAGDLLICEGGAGVGQTSIWQGELERCAFQKALHRLRPWSNNEIPRFLYYCMRYAVESGVVLAGGTATIPHLTGEQLRRYRFPCPPVEEQQEIVAFLDCEAKKFDTLAAETQRAIDLLQERRTALITAAVTGQIDVRYHARKEFVP